MANKKGSVHENLTQKERILKCLKKKRGRRVSCRDIMMNCRTMQYNARIWQLRHKEGYDIENKLKTVINGFGEKVRYGFFRLKK